MQWVSKYITIYQRIFLYLSVHQWYAQDSFRSSIYEVLKQTNLIVLEPNNTNLILSKLSNRYWNVLEQNFKGKVLEQFQNILKYLGISMRAISISIEVEIFLHQNKKLPRISSIGAKIRARNFRNI